MSSRRGIVDHVVKKALGVSSNSSSDSEESEHPEDASMLAVKDGEDAFDAMFAFMKKSDDEFVNEKKQNVNVFSIRKLRKLVVVLIDLISELTTEKDLLNNSLDIFQDENIAMVTQIYDMRNK